MKYLKKIELKDNICILYNENSILVKTGNIDKVLCNEYCSEPSINNNEDKLVYISPMEWEERAKLMIYDIQDNILKEIEINEIPDQYTIKKVTWLDEKKLIMIVGFANGTVTVGGDIFIYDIDSKEYNNIYKSLDREEVKNFDLKGDMLEIEVVTFDEDFNRYSTRKESIKIRHREVIL